MIRALTAGHRECPAELRERLAARWDRGLLPPASAAGTVVLSTCNRFEVYVSTEAGHGDEAAKSLRSIAGVESEPGVRELLGGEAVRHLFRVSSGLESMVLGEAEILGQVRRAYTAAVEAGTVDQTLSHLFHEALRVGRRARRETGIGKRPRSVPALAARAAATHVESLADVHPLILGTGEAAVLAARAFSRLGAASPVFLSTDEGRARTVAAAEGGCGDGLARLEKRLQGSDIVVAARGRGVPDITARTVRRSQAARGSRTAVIVDLGVPRDVEPDAGAVPGVTLLNMDTLQELTDRHEHLQRAEVPAVERLVAEAACDFERWLRARAVVPSITALTAWAESVRKRQLARASGVGAASAEEWERALDRFSTALVRQLLHPLITAMRDEAEGTENARAVTALIGLESEAGP